MYWETFYGRHTAQHQLQWRQIKIKNEFHEVSIKTKQAMLRTRSNMRFFFFSLKGKLLPSEYSDLARIRARPRFYACLDYLQVS